MKKIITIFIFVLFTFHSFSQTKNGNDQLFITDMVFPQKILLQVKKTAGYPVDYPDIRSIRNPTKSVSGSCLILLFVFMLRRAGFIFILCSKLSDAYWQVTIRKLAHYTVYMFVLYQYNVKRTDISGIPQQTLQDISCT